MGSVRRTSKGSHQRVLRQEVLRLAEQVFLTLQNVLAAILPGWTGEGNRNRKSAMRNFYLYNKSSGIERMPKIKKRKGEKNGSERV